MFSLIVILSWFLHLSSYLSPSKQPFLLLLPSPPHKPQSTLQFPFPNTRKRHWDCFGRKWEWGQIPKMSKIQAFLLSTGTPIMFMKRGKPTSDSVGGNMFLHLTYTWASPLAAWLARQRVGWVPVAAPTPFSWCSQEPCSVRVVSQAGRTRSQLSGLHRSRASVYLLS